MNTSITKNKFVNEWIKEMADMVKPSEIILIDGTEAQAEALRKEACSTGEMIKLNQDTLPGCYLHRTAINDVARVEDRTFICTSKKEDAGNINNWMDPKECYAKLSKLYEGSYSGKPMYVIPYSMSVVGSDFAKYGIELTDSIYVVLNMLIMTRVGLDVLDALGESPDFIKGLHAKAELDEEKRYICHFPEDNTIWSVNSGYGGNVLLGKKCFALRIASYLGRKEGWMAEHMLILGVEGPKGDIQYVSAAFPSACGKTNLAMLIPPEKYRAMGYKVWTVGDDIAWLRIGADGRLWAVNPEAGFFGVAPGTSMKSNPNALLTCQKNTIFTNVVVTPDKNVWWESMGVDAPAKAIDWKGNEWTPEMGTKGAHPNSRFTAPACQCPCISSEWENPAGVPISAIVFGGRRAKVAPLVYQSFDWEHGVFVGATMASETTAAATGAVGVVRRDPMAMRPFCGYNMGEYFQHWLEMGKKIPNPPKIFNVNWFRVDENGKFVWPGFGDNLRVLLWILARCNDQVDAVESPIGYLPKVEDIDLEGTSITTEVLADLLSIDKESWMQEVEDQKAHLAQFEKLPAELQAQYEALAARIAAM